MTLIVAGQASDFTTDPNILLLNLLKNTWNGGFYFGSGSFIEGTGSFQNASPAYSSIAFQTSFANLGTRCAVIVRPYDKTIAPKQIGLQRWRYHDRHEVHVYAVGPNLLTTRWQMERRITELLLCQIESLGEGAQLQFLQSFQTVPQNESGKKRGVAKALQTARSMAIVDIMYDKVVS